MNVVFDSEFAPEYAGFWRKYKNMPHWARIPEGYNERYLAQTQMYVGKRCKVIRDFQGSNTNGWRKIQSNKIYEIEKILLLCDEKVWVGFKGHHEIGWVCATDIRLIDAPAGEV